MKRTLFFSGVGAAVLCATLASATSGLGNHIRAVASASATSTVTTAETTPSVGVSIGTVDAFPYYQSGLDLPNFSADYVAQLNENTYIGFGISYIWAYDEETGNEVRRDCACVSAIHTTEEAVTIPDYIKVDETVYPVGSFGYSYGIAADALLPANVKYLTLPSTISIIQTPSDFGSSLTALYMLGRAPNLYYETVIAAPKIYICSKKHYLSYLNNQSFPLTELTPYGWSFEWVTVDVKKNGEFAETYLTQNDYDWGAVEYLKVTGNINDIDLGTIKNLTSLLKLDLSETSITELPEEFMRNRTTLLEVRLPETLNKIGDSAFYGCRNLQSFDLKGMTEIGDNVFNDCKSLETINLTGIKTIGYNAFRSCTKLDNIDLSSVEYIASGAFRYCSSLHAANLSSIKMIGYTPTTGQGYETFAGCSSLKEVVLGEDLTYVGSSSFSNTAIESIELPGKLSILPNSMFAYCQNLKSVYIPATVTMISSDVFYNCTALTDVKMETGLINIGRSAFNGCSALEEIIIPASVTSIESDAFSNTAIRSFTCYAVVPPNATGSFIGAGMDMTRTFLYVPPFSKDYYRNTEYWSDFYLMASLKDQIEYLNIDRPLTINIEEEDNEVVANNPTIALVTGTLYDSDGYSTRPTVGQLTAIGDGTLSAGTLCISGVLSSRRYQSQQYCPTLINYADKMRADNVTLILNFSNYSSYNPEWHFISVPFNVKVSEILPGPDAYWTIRRYDSAARAAGETASTWVNLTNDDTLEAGKGYILSITGGESYTTSWGEQLRYYPYLKFFSGNSLTKNNMFRSTDVTVELTEYVSEFAHNRSWNLIGNPYPCYFDMHYLNEEFTAPVTVWNGNAYVAYSPVDDNLVLSPYEAFFVQCPLDSKEMTFREAGRMHSDKAKPLYKAPATEQHFITADDRNVFNFEIANGERTDRARIVLNPEASAAYEIGRDASKFFADNSDCAQIYVRSDVNYSIDERPLGDATAVLGIRASKEETYTLSLSGRYSSEWHVMLTDRLTGITTDLTLEPYSFSASADDAADRFMVEFSLAGDILSGVDSIIEAFGANAEVTVTALNGTVIFSGRMDAMNVPADGIYVITDGKRTRKAILK